jgi:hypothetical protein
MFYCQHMSKNLWCHLVLSENYVRENPKIPRFIIDACSSYHASDLKSLHFWTDSWCSLWVRSSSFQTGRTTVWASLPSGWEADLGMGWDGMGWVEGDFPTRNGIELPGTRNIANFAGGKCGLRIFGKSLGCLWPPTIRGLTWGTSTLSPKLPWVSTTLGSHRGSFRPTYIWPIYTKSHRFVRSCRCIFSFDFLKLLSC